MKWKFVFGALVLVVGGLVGYGISQFFLRYQTKAEMYIPIIEKSTLEYPDDPAHLSVYYARYGNRFLRLVQQSSNQFDLLFESTDPNVATVSLRSIDLSSFIPTVPSWLKDDSDLTTLTLVEREWNRQQVAFHPTDQELYIDEGDGFEKEHIVSVELARNCLNAGLWEILFFTIEKGKKALLYHGWFTLPLGHYKALFEKNNAFAYLKHMLSLEHWISPEGKLVDLNKLRTVLSETKVKAHSEQDQRVFAAGEQERKIRTVSAKEVLYFKDFSTKSQNIHFATFAPPGCYQANQPWGNEFEKFANLGDVTVRKVQNPNQQNPLDEIELNFRDTQHQPSYRLYISGVVLDSLPQLEQDDYTKGLERPMGISIPPVNQTYQELIANPPYQSPFFSVLLDQDNHWIDHHKAAIDGSVLHKDINNPTLLHLYLLSYERHCLVGHYIIKYTEKERNIL